MMIFFYILLFPIYKYIYISKQNFPTVSDILEKLWTKILIPCSETHSFSLHKLIFSINFHHF